MWLCGDICGDVQHHRSGGGSSGSSGVVVVDLVVEGEGLSMLT